MGYKTKSMLHAKSNGPISNYYAKVKTKLDDLNKVSENKSSVNKYSDESKNDATRSSSRSKINPGTGARLGDTASQVWDFFSKKNSPKGSGETEIEGQSLVSSNENPSSAEATETSSLGPQKSGFESGLGVKLSPGFSEKPKSIDPVLDMINPESLPTLSTKPDAFSKGMGRKNKKKVVSAEALSKSIKEKQNVSSPQEPSIRQENNFVQSKDHSTALQKAKQKFGNRTEFNLTHENGMYTYTKK